MANCCHLGDCFELCLNDCEVYNFVNLPSLSGHSRKPVNSGKFGFRSLELSESVLQVLLVAKRYPVNYTLWATCHSASKVMKTDNNYAWPKQPLQLIISEIIPFFHCAIQLLPKQSEKSKAFCISIFQLVFQCCSFIDNIIAYRAMAIDLLEGG